MIHQTGNLYLFDLAINIEKHFSLIKYHYTDFIFQARQVLEREFNNLLQVGTDRRLEEVSKGTLLLFVMNVVVCVGGAT